MLALCLINILISRLKKACDKAYTDYSTLYESETRNYQNNVVEPLNKDIKRVIDKAINISYEDLHTEERDIIRNIGNDNNLSSLLRTNCKDGRFVEVDLNELNITYNLMMYCSYPYTMDNGEIFNSVYVNSYYDFYCAVRGNLNLMSKYFDYMENFVYPMIRQYGRNGMSPVELNNYVINEIRLQKRHNEMLEKLTSLNNSIKEAKRAADNIYNAIVVSHNETQQKLEEIHQSIENIEFNVDVYVSDNGSAHCYRW